MVMGWTFGFQIINTLLLLAIFIGIPLYIVNKLRNIESRLKSIEEKLGHRTGEL